MNSLPWGIMVLGLDMGSGNRNKVLFSFLAWLNLLSTSRNDRRGSGRTFHYIH